MKRILLVVAACMVFTAMFGAGNAQAVKLGPLELHPYLEFRTVYDDNVFVQNANAVDDTFFLISPGILLQLGQKDNRLELEYRSDIYRYVDTGDSNDVEDYYVRGAASFNFPRGLSINIRDLGSRAHEPRSQSNLAITAVKELNRYWSNDLDAEVAYALSDRFRVALEYKNYYISYSLASNKFRDRDENGVSGTVFYKFLPKTSLLLQGIYKNVDHIDGSEASQRLNSNEYWAMTGLTWDITAKSTGTLKAGYEWKIFDFPGRKNFRSPTYMVKLDHRFTPKTSVAVMGIRQASETDDPAVPYYTTTTGSVWVTFKPVKKVSVSPHGTFASERYAGATTVLGDRARRLETVWESGVDISYELNKWLAFTAGYRHTKRSSTITFYDYTDNMATFMFRATL